MNYEEKYKEALRRAKGFMKQEYKDVAAYIFPELKVSWDEEIRLKTLNYFKENQHEIEVYRHVEVGDIISWLEERGKNAWNKWSGRRNPQRDSQILVRRSEQEIVHALYVDNGRYAIVKAEKVHGAMNSILVTDSFRDGDEWIYLNDLK